MSKVKTYAVTFRPYNGVTDEQIAKLCKWCDKKYHWDSLITEKLDDKRHVHMAVYLEQPVAAGNMRNTLTRLFKELSEEERTVFRNGIKIMYNHDWLTNYLEKGDDTVEIASRLPTTEGPGYLESYYPPPLEDRENKAKRAADAYYANLEVLFYEHQPRHLDVNPENVRHFLYDMMYAKRLIRVIADDRKILQVSRHLSRYINKSTTCHLEVPPYEVDM